MGGKKHTIQKKRAQPRLKTITLYVFQSWDLLSLVICVKNVLSGLFYGFLVCGYVAAVRAEEVHENMFLQEDATALKQNKTNKVPSEGFKGQRA